MYNLKYTIPVALMTVAAFGTTLFSFIYATCFGLFALILKLSLVCAAQERETKNGIIYAILSWIVAVIQIIAAATVNSRFIGCSGQNIIMCQEKIYRAMNAVGASLWIACGVLILVVVSSPARAVQHATIAAAEAKQSSFKTATSCTETDGCEILMPVELSNGPTKSMEEVRHGDCIV